MPIRADSAQDVLVLGDTRQTLTVTRSLGTAGYGVIVGNRGDPIVFCRYGRFVKALWNRNEQSGGHEHFAVALTTFLDHHPSVAWIYPVGESDILALLPHREDLEDRAGLIMPPTDTVYACLDKSRTYATAGEAGLPVAPFHLVHDPDELTQALERAGYPWVVKPISALSTVNGQKAVILYGPADRHRHLGDWPQGNSALIVQRYAPGRRHNCHFLADEGRVLAYFEQRVLRTDRANGTGYGVDGISVAPNEILRRHCESLARRLNYCGVGCAQFIVNETHLDARFLELNPRLDASCAIPYYYGYDFPLMALDHARYRHGQCATPPSQTTPYPVGRRGIWLLGDIEGLGHELRRGRIKKGEAAAWLWRSLRTAVAADVHLTWSWKDPLPVAFMLGRLFMWLPAKAGAALARRVGIARSTRA